MKNKNSVPQYVEWQITAKCNFRCIHCSASHRNPENDLSTPKAISLVHELLDENVRSITLSGGEPLLRDDFELIVGILKENNISVQVISNGQLINEQRARALSHMGVNFVWLSLDGPEQAHNIIRQHPNAYRGVMNAAALLEKVAVPYGFMTTVLSTNFDQLRELSLIIQSTSSALWQIWLGNRCNDAPIWPGIRQIRQVIEDLPMLRSRTPQLIIGDNIGYSDTLEKLRTPAFAEYTAASRFTGCYGAKTIMGILNDGRIKGCLSMPDTETGVPMNETAPLRQRFRKAATLHHRSVAKALRQCSGCSATPKCQGGCPAWAVTSKNDTIPRFCYVPSIQTQQAPLRASTLSASLLTLCTLTSTGCHSASTAANTPMSPHTNPGSTAQKQNVSLHNESTADTASGNEPPQRPEHTGPAAPSSAESDSANPVESFPPCMMSHIGCPPPSPTNRSDDSEKK
ncbi:MAG: radical SAM protein [Deltaproteobacteria bacterium]|nr:radical SAM protein [Deltaproteobacteria bacterium]